MFIAFLTVSAVSCFNLDERLAFLSELAIPCSSISASRCWALLKRSACVSRLISFAFSFPAFLARLAARAP